MKKLFPILLCTLLFSCGTTTEEQDTPETNGDTASFTHFLDQFKDIPAFPFQFGVDNLHTEPHTLSDAERSTFYSIDSVIQVDALHKFKTEQGWVCFSLWTEDSVSNIEVSIFDEKGELIDTDMAFPPNFSKKEYKMTQKVEVWENSIEFIYTESFNTEYTAIYSDKFEIDEYGFTLSPPIDFWKKIPRELWSDIQKHTLNDKGNYEVEEQNEKGWYQVTDVIDRHIKTQIKLIDTTNYIYGITHSEQDDNDVVTSRFAFIKLRGFDLVDVTDQVIGPNLTKALSTGMYERDYYEKSGFFRVICGNGNKHSYTRLEFDDEGFYIQSYGKNGQTGQPTLRAKWEGKQFEVY